MCKFGAGNPLSQAAAQPKDSGGSVQTKGWQAYHLYWCVEVGDWAAEPWEGGFALVFAALAAKDDE